MKVSPEISVVVKLDNASMTSEKKYGYFKFG